MAPCTDFDPLIAERAAGAGTPEDAAKLDAHLATCDRCRAELAAYEQALGLARLPAPTDAERQALSHLPTRVRADLEHAPLFKALGRLLGLTAIAAAVVVLIANKVLIPSASRHGPEASAAATWEVPDPDALFAKVEQQHPELAVASDAELARAELIADAAYSKVLAGE
jgi:anti-sigma factor RsiW